MEWVIRKHGVVGSTMDLAAQLAQSGAPAGTVVWADEQTSGRGRLGRTWHAPAGLSLLVTVVLRPQMCVARNPQLSREIAERVAVAVERVTGLLPDLKDPNDLLIGGRKLAGILCQTSIRGESLDYLLVGIGLNVNVPADTLPLHTATSLLAATGRAHNRDALLRAILEELESLPGLVPDATRDPGAPFGLAADDGQAR